MHKNSYQELHDFIAKNAAYDFNDAALAINAELLCHIAMAYLGTCLK